MSVTDIRELDPQLIEIFDAAVDLYNRETKLLESATESSASINATHFLARQAFQFATAALSLMEDARQPLFPAAALLRTCLEAQARANHIVAATGEDREKLATEFFDMLTAGRDYYEVLTADWYKKFGSEVPALLSKDKRILEAIQAKIEKIDTSQLKNLRAKHQKLSSEWSYATVIGRDKMTDPNWQMRTGPQGIQPSLYLHYVQYCSFVHCDPTSLRFEGKLNVLAEGHCAVLAAFSALTSFMTALGKCADPKFQEIRKAMVAFSVPLVQKTLRKASNRPASGAK
jgi:hypothetical protein